MRFVVTGGAGFIGSNIVKSLIQNKHDVVVIDNLHTGKKENLDPIYENVAIAALLVISEKRFTKLGFSFINLTSNIYITIFKFSLKFT